MTGALTVLGPVVADGTIGRAAWGLVLATQTAGMVLGGLLAMSMRVRRLLRLGIIASFVAVPWLVTLAESPTLVALLPLALVTGMAMEQFGIAWETTLQNHVPADKLARIYSYDAVGSFVAMPAGQAAAGPIAQAVGAANAPLVAAGLIAAALLGMLASRDVRRLPCTPAEVSTPAATAML